MSKRCDELGCNALYLQEKCRIGVEMSPMCNPLDQVGAIWRRRLMHGAGARCARCSCEGRIKRVAESAKAADFLGYISRARTHFWAYDSLLES